MSVRHDIVLRGGDVVDGTGAPRLRADVAVDRGRVVAVGDLRTAEAVVDLDVTGLAVTPGFIDVHSHDDLAVLVDPELRCKTLQGVTTQVVGNCGLGCAPCAAAKAVFGGWHPEALDLPDWDGHAGWYRLIDERPPSLNVAPLVAHGSLRRQVMGFSPDRTCTADELLQMQRLVEEGVEAGCVGMSTGLIYEPGRSAGTDEIVALAALVAAAGGRYTSHLRDEGNHLLDAVAEAIGVGERAGIGVQLSHHKAAGRRNWGRVRESLALVDEAAARGVDVMLDQYPYTRSSTAMIAVLQNRALDDGTGGMGDVPPSAVTIAAAPGHESWEGLDLVALGALLGIDPRSAAQHTVDVMGEACMVVVDLMAEDDVTEVLRHPRTLVGSDGAMAGSRPHPRLWGTFPRVLGRYARTLGVLGFEEAVHRMTGLSARTFGLTDRGEVRVGAFADLAVVDPATVLDTGTYADPQRPPVGVPHVIVNGTVIVRDGVHTGARPGRGLRRG